MHRLTAGFLAIAATMTAAPAFAQTGPQNGIGTNTEIVNGAIIKKKATAGPCMRPDQPVSGFSLLGVQGQTTSGQNPTTAANTHGVRGLRDSPASADIKKRYEDNQAAMLAVAKSGKYPYFIGTSWTYRTEPDGSRVQDKEVVSYLIVDFQEIALGLENGSLVAAQKSLIDAQRAVAKATDEGHLDTARYAEEHQLRDAQNQYEQIQKNISGLEAKAAAFQAEMAPLWATEAALNQAANDLCK